MNYRPAVLAILLTVTIVWQVPHTIVLRYGLLVLLGLLGWPAAVAHLARPATQAQRRARMPMQALAWFIAWSIVVALFIARNPLESLNDLRAEWLAVPTPMLDEVADLRRIHSLPHRRSGVVLGLANVRGELLVCVSLGAQLGIDPADQAPAMRGPRLAHKRLLVLRRQGQRLACPVDEVHGNERFEEREHRPVPATVARASASYTRAVLAWRGQVVGLLDEELLFNALHRSLA